MQQAIENYKRMMYIADNIDRGSKDGLDYQKLQQLFSPQEKRRKIQLIGIHLMDDTKLTFQEVCEYCKQAETIFGGIKQEPIYSDEQFVKYLINCDIYTQKMAVNGTKYEEAMESLKCLLAYVLRIIEANAKLRRCFEGFIARKYVWIKHQIETIAHKQDDEHADCTQLKEYLEKMEAIRKIS
ncbi:unnamed protein product [Didymodactylos carnosus]|uniref:Uncharacterized protein n=1 Tax=Didymodactylos carnosus TaxID=1234261 RepID=A0A815H9J0_9BILA|nr:unnamed protein product [Didymodactylos carnosus]CAF4217926.1 unnamed protein product [Didymodactylos carnosus]